MALTPARVTRLLSLVRHPVRLPLLLELERLGESSATELSEVLGAPFDKVNYALKQLVEEGAVEFVRRQPRPSSNTSRNIYRARVTGWAEFLELLDDYAARLPALDDLPEVDPGEEDGGDPGATAPVRTTSER